MKTTRSIKKLEDFDTVEEIQSGALPNSKAILNSYNRLIPEGKTNTNNPMNPRRSNLETLMKQISTIKHRDPNSAESKEINIKEDWDKRNEETKRRQSRLGAWAG
jgi:hypothetical protein